MEQHDDVHLKFHFEVGGLQCGAGEQPREDHVDGDREAPTNITVGDLDVLDLRGVSGVSFGAPAGLHADQLQLYALDGGLRALDHQLPCQRLRDDAVGRVEMSPDEEFGEQGSLFDVLQGFRRDGEVHGTRGQLPLLRSRVNDEFAGLCQVLGQQRPPHVTAQGILNVDEHAVVSLIQNFVALHVQRKFKRNFCLATGKLAWLHHFDGTVDNTRRRGRSAWLAWCWVW